MKQNRVDAVLRHLEDLGLSQILISDPMTILYLTGRLIRPFERFYALYLSRSGNHKIFINQLETVPEDLGVEKVRFSDSDPYLDLVAKAINPNEPLGVDKDLPARFLLPLMDRRAAKGFVNASLAADLARGVKDEEEQALMRRSSQINDEAIVQFQSLVHAGVTELEIAGQVEDIYRSLGADGLAFSPLVAFGANAASGHHYPDSTVLQPGDCVLIDVGCTYEGYCSDMTRTCFYKTVSPRQELVYNLVRRANESAEAKVRPGVPLRELDLTARNIITEAGFGPCFTHRLGHFCGLQDHDFGDVSSSATATAQAGNIFSIEPGVYVDGELGVRIEDLVLVTEGGVEVLNKVPKELKILE